MNPVPQTKDDAIASRWARLGAVFNIAPALTDRRFDSAGPCGGGEGVGGFCLAPAKALRKAGIKPEGKNVYELADGSPVELEYGFARISLMGGETVTPIIFGPEGSEPILGVLALAAR